MYQIKESHKKMDSFSASNSNQNLTVYEQNLTVFLQENLKSSYNKPEYLFEIDSQLSRSLIDSLTMDAWNVSNADVILFQGWGSCGQVAILLAQVMHNSGYESRIAHFKGVDHEWAEVNNGTNWLIVDPWYIGNLVEIHSLRNAKAAFQHATGVEVQTFDNVNWIDASKEHGY
jgi:hypothetical protein